MKSWPMMLIDTSGQSCASGSQLGPELRFRIAFARVGQSLRRGGEAVPEFHAAQQRRSRDRIGRRVAGRLDERRHEPLHEDARQLRMRCKEIGSVTSMSGRTAFAVL